MAKKAVVKTKPTVASVADFLNGIESEQKRADSFTLLNMMKEATGEEPKMWGASIVGFGDVVVTSAAGRVVDWFRVGFAPRKTNLSLYLWSNLQSQTEALAKLGKHKTGSGCLYINKLEDVDLKVLKGMIASAIKNVKV